MAEDQLGFRKAYKMTGKPGYAGGPGETTIDAGNSGSHRDNNWKIGAGQSKLRNAKQIGPGKELKDIKGGNFY